MRSTPLLIVIALGLVLPDCKGAEEDPVQVVDPAPTPSAHADGVNGCDAGDEAFVRRAITFVWGRLPASVAEVEVLLGVLAQTDRATLIRAMTYAPDYLERWRTFIWDTLAVARIHQTSSPGCYGTSTFGADSAALAEHVRDHEPEDPAPNLLGWTMVDLAHSALRLDDLSPVFRAHLLANMFHEAGAIDVDHAFEFRAYRAGAFLSTYLNRTMVCMSCHNSDWGTPDKEDPAMDHHWPITGSYEKALFEVETGRPIADLVPFFRRYGLVPGFRYRDAKPDDLKDDEWEAAISPWGMADRCGRLLPRGVMKPDDREESAFLIAAHDETASIWDVEDMLAEGFAKARVTPPPTLESSNGMDSSGESSLAWLSAVNFADVVWREAVGARLVMPNAFPRNPHQRDVLLQLASAYVSDGYSLRALLVEVTAHPYFNQAAPAECGADAPDYLLPVFDPMATNAAPDAGNTVGGLMGRLRSRSLLRTLTNAMGWSKFPEFLIYLFERDTNIQRDLGVFLKLTDPGFDGIGLQVSLAFEAAYGTCADPRDVTACPLVPILESANLQTVCPVCMEEPADLCGWDARCCDVDWDALCPDDCEPEDDWPIEFATFPKYDTAQDDFIVRLLAEAAKAPSTTAAEAISALKDRLLADPVIEADEVGVLESLLGAPLDQPITQINDADAGLRRVCTLLLRSPQFLLTRVPGPDRAGSARALVVPGTRFEDICGEVATWITPALTLDCNESGVGVRLAR